MRLHRRVFNAINPSDWIVTNDVWGFTDTQTHGGVIDDNVTFDDEGNVVLVVNGDWYVGEKQGIVATQDISVTGGQRTGASLQSVNTYGPGRFEAQIKFPSFNGICTSMWLYNYRDNGESTLADNWEIDIEVHGSTKGNVGNYQTPLFTTWTTLTDYTSNYVDIGYSLADGLFHTLRIDWHTGNNPRVEYYVDGKLWCVQTTNVPTNQMYLNIGCWFPTNWCGEPQFESDFAIVKSFTYTPFEGESATTYECQTLTSSGWQNDVTTPVKNLVANGSFDNSLTAYSTLQQTTESLRSTTEQQVTLEHFGWACTDENATVSNSQITFDGSLTQLISVDCLGERFELQVNGSGNASVTVYYQSIFDDVIVSGSVDIPLNQITQFTPPSNCSQLKLEIVSNGSVTLKNVVLTVA